MARELCYDNDREAGDTSPWRGVLRGLPLPASPPVTLEPTAFPQASKTSPAQTKIGSPRGPRPPLNTYESLGPTDRDLDKIAQNSPCFEPNLEGSHDTSIYLKDIDFYLRKFPNATIDDQIYLIKVTSSCDVSSFIEREPANVKGNYDLLCQALEEEFSDHLTQTGLTAALSIKQGRQESPQEYYYRMRQAYFDSQNEPGMEEDLNFKSLFVQNLHPTTSHHVGVAACPAPVDTCAN